MFLQAIETVPFPANLAVAPIAADAVYTQGEVYASAATFETGTAYVPNTGIAMIHKGERVIDADSNKQITRSLAGGGSGGGGDNHFHFSGAIQVNGGKDSGADFMKSVQMQIRKFKMA